MTAVASQPSLPSLPNEVLARVFTLAAAAARANLRSYFDPMDPVLHALPRLSRQWCEFGREELYREIHVYCNDHSYTEPGGTWERGYRLLTTLSVQPALARLVKRLTVHGSDSYDRTSANKLVKLCPGLEYLSLTNVSFCPPEGSIFEGTLPGSLQSRDAADPSRAVPLQT